jgi:hypothetical protein
LKERQFAILPFDFLGVEEEIPMRWNTTFLAMVAIVCPAVLSASSARADWWWYSSRGGYEYRGGFVKPCSLDGVNPAHHPGIFGNPAFARSIYGFVQSRDGTWYVEKSCTRGLDHD